MTMKNTLTTQKEKNIQKVHKYIHVSIKGGSENFLLGMKSKHHCYRQEEHPSLDISRKIIHFKIGHYKVDKLRYAELKQSGGK